MTVVDLDSISAADLAELASAKRLRELSSPSPPRSPEDPPTAKAWVAQDRRRRRKRSVPLRPGPAEWLKDDPNRLIALVVQMSRFTDDEERIAVGALDLSELLGIDQEAAVKAIGTGIREARALRQDRSKGGPRGA